MILADAAIAHLADTGVLRIDPYDPALIQPSSLDVRLGTQFQVRRNNHATHIDPLDPPAGLTEHLTIANGDTFVLHPGEFALGHTVETVRLPADLVATVNGKSSLGRHGLLVHATAGYIDPGFDGQIVFELANVNTLPIVLHPGMKIAQLVFHRMDQPAQRPYGHPELGSKYQHQRGAQGSRYEHNR